LQHPGGDEVILSEAGEYLSYTRPRNCSPSILALGKDATEAFEDVGHSDEARALLPGLQVGEFEKGENVGLTTNSLFFLPSILNTHLTSGNQGKDIPIYCGSGCYGECCSTDIQVRLCCLIPKAYSSHHI